MTYRLLYFASMADQAGCAAESVVSDARDPAALYTEICALHAFTMARSRLRIAVNGQIVDWNRALQDGDEIVFLPPVSGG